jgi:hypothetical protein
MVGHVFSGVVVVVTATDSLPAPEPLQTLIFGKIPNQTTTNPSLSCTWATRKPTNIGLGSGYGPFSLPENLLFCNL